MVSTRAGGRSLVAPDVISVALQGETSSQGGSQVLPPELLLSQTPRTGSEVTIQEGQHATAQVQNPGEATQGQGTDGHEEESAKEEYGIIDNLQYRNWLEDHSIDKDQRLPPVPISKLKINPTIRTSDDQCEILQRSFIANYGYQPSLGEFIVSESYPGEQPQDIHYHHCPGALMEVGMAFDDTLRANQRWSHMADKCFIVWDGNHRVKAWMDHLNNMDTNEEDVPLVYCRVIKFEATEIPDLMVILSAINK